MGTGSAPGVAQLLFPHPRPMKRLFHFQTRRSTARFPKSRLMFPCFTSATEGQTPWLVRLSAVQAVHSWAAPDPMGTVSSGAYQRKLSEKPSGSYSPFAATRSSRLTRFPIPGSMR